MLASVLQEAGYKVGLYTSPHLKDFRERVKINGKLIKKIEVVNFIKNNKSFFEANNLSFFEMTVGLAFDCFANHKVDVAVVEVGLGGRLDSTNIIMPEVSVITNIGYDHMQFLGDTLPEIAFEKAGIIKNKVPVVIGEYQAESFPVFEKIAKEKSAPLFLAANNENIVYTSDLKGSYQIHNIKTVLQTIEVLKTKGFVILEKNIRSGLLKVVKNTGLLGRWQVIKEQPKVICDTAHNAEGLRYVLKQLQEEKFEQLHIVLGVVNDKDLKSVLPLFPKNATYYFCKPNIPRGLDEVEFQLQCAKFQLMGEAYNSVSLAYKTAMEKAKKNDLIYVGGSTFVVAEVV